MIEMSEAMKAWRKKNFKKVWDKTYRRAYWPNSIRYEDIDGDNQKAYRCIYINGERVETAPLCATESEARSRLLDLCEENWVEEEQYVRKEVN